MATIKQVEQQDENKQTVPQTKAKKDSLKFVWVLLHVAILALGIYLLGATLLLRKQRWYNRLIYRLDFVLIASTYMFSVLHYLEGEIVRTSALLAMDSVQYLLLAAVWIVMPMHETKLVPFTVVSLLHVLDSFTPKLALQYSRPLSLTIGYSNLLIFFKLLVDFLCIRTGGMSSLIFYGVFYRFRFEFSPVDKHCALYLYSHVDALLSRDTNPAKVREYWGRIKNKIEHYDSKAVIEERRMEEKKAIKEANLHHSATPP